MKKNIKLIYNNVEKGIIGIHLFACLFISGNIFFILLAMIGSLIIMKLCEISVSFIYTIPFITEDDRRRIAEKESKYKKQQNQQHLLIHIRFFLLVLCFPW